MESEKRMECSMGHLLDLRCCDLGLTSINSWGRFPSQCVIFIEMRALRSLSPTHPRGKERWGVGGNGDACHDKRTWILWLFLASSLPPSSLSLPCARPTTMMPLPLTTVTLKQNGEKKESFLEAWEFGLSEWVFHLPCFSTYSQRKLHLIAFNEPRVGSWPILCLKSYILSI